MENFVYLEAKASKSDKSLFLKIPPPFLLNFPTFENAVRLVLFRSIHSKFVSPFAGDLMNSTMPWEVVDYGEGTSKGNLFEFNQKQNSLQTKRAGMYFIYVVLNLTCTHRNHCTPGRLHVQVGDKLTCEVELQSEQHVTKKCWTVSKVESEKLLAQMTVPKTGLTNWKLDLKGSGLGMFLVD